MKKLITIAITLFVLIGLSFTVKYYTHSTFLDYSFFVGLAATVMIWFFTSKGGFTSRNVDLTVQGRTGIKAEQQRFEFKPNLVFFTSLAYTIITLAALFYQYRSYF